VPSNPKVSIVIPVYNGAKYLRGAIESALAQTYENTEVIVINDGSTDFGETESMAESFGDRIRYYYKSNGGVSSALNLGISLMKGEYFSWLSHDDTYSPTKIERQLSFVQNNLGVEIVGSGLEVINESGDKVSSYTTGSTVVVENGRDVMHYWVYGCSLLIKRSIFESIGMFNENNRTTQDLELWLQIVFSGKSITLLSEILCQWRHHPAMGSYTLRPDVLREIEKLFRELLGKYPLHFFSNIEGRELKGREKALVYDWLGEQARHRGAENMANVLFWKAAMVYPNPLDKLFLSTIRKSFSRFLRQRYRKF
jgi:glycosyltransferase involved in cell wall biosynthesis